MSHLYLSPMAVRIHSLALFAVVNSASPASVGILLGEELTDTVVVSTAFEIAVKSGVVDAEYLAKRLDQFHTVLPHLLMVGVYQLKQNGTEPDSLTLSVAEQLNRPGLFYTLVNLPVDSAPIQSYILRGGEFVRLHTSIVADDIENISISTINNHPKYLQNSTKRKVEEVDFVKVKETLTSSVEQLGAKIEEMLLYLRSDKPSIEVNNMIMQLCKKLQVIKKMPEPDFTSNLYASELALLTSKLVALEKLQVLVHENMSRARIRSRTNQSAFHLTLS